MSNIDEVKRLKDELNAVELILRDYYAANGAVCPYEKLGELLKREAVKRELFPHANHSEDFNLYLQEITKILLEPVSFKNIHSTMSDALFIYAEDDFAIHPHPRYFGSGQHYHDFYEVAYVFSGQAKQTVWAGATKTSFIQKAGEFLIMPPGVSHAILVDDDSLVLNLIMRTKACKSSLLKNLPDGSAFEEFFQRTLYSDDPIYLLLHTDNDIEIQNRFLDIIAVLEGNDLYKRELSNLTVSVFFLCLLCRADTVVDVHDPIMKTANYVPAIIQYMEKNFQTISPGDISRVFGFTQAYVGQFYRKYTGKTLTETLLSIRLRHASMLLLEKQYRISEICMMVGYSDETSFIRQFKRAYGVTPHQYRVSL